MSAAVDLVKNLRILAALAKFELTPDLVDLYLDELTPCGLNEAAGVLRRFATKTNPKTGMPTIDALKAELGALEATDDTLARDAASRAVAAIVKHGWNNPKDAEAYMGELAWFTVQKMGGWVPFCGLSDHEGLGFIESRVREMAKLNVGKLKSGNHEALALPPGERQHLRLTEGENV